MSGMTLREYKEENDLSLAQLAKKIGLSLSQTSDLMNGKSGCSLKVAVKIERVTEEQVRCRDLLLKPARAAR